MIEINLIPDVKQEMIRAQKMRNTAITLSVLLALVSGGLVAALGILVGVQALHENIVRDQITKQFSTLQNTTDIDKALTVQSQLSSISELNDKKTINSRAFDVISAINPAAPNDIRYSSIVIDPTTKTLTIEAVAANSYSATDTFRKLILNTKIEGTAEGQATSVPLTDDVIISDASYGENGNSQRVLSFKASFVYPDGLFDNTLQNIRIVTPTSKTDVTDSHLGVPLSLFSAPVKTTEGDKK